MAKCDVSIELDEPDRVHPGGGKVTGTVRVHVDADVHCSGLEVKSVWRTHGRGNVDSGETGSVVLFTGEWQAGQTLDYRFELPIADWPPTYHGHYLNIDHYIDARAKIPWAFDPKASVPLRMTPTCGPEGAMVDKNVIEITGLARGVTGCVVLGAFVIPCVALLASFGPLVLVVLVIPALGGAVWLIRNLLPKYVLGEVRYEVASDELSPGERVVGELVIRPRKSVSVNGVTMDFQARERCISGSGSNRTTHKHVFFQTSLRLQEATTLAAGTEHRFPFQVELPADAPYSIELDANALIWSANLRVDIPRWPDWVKEIPVRVVPSTTRSRDRISESKRDSAATVASTDSQVATDGTITFAETAQHIWSLRDDREQVEALVEAVSGLTFDLEAKIERRLLYAGDEDPHVYRDGYAVWAHYPDPKLAMVLYVPHELADDFEQTGRENWRGRGTIVGWDGLHGRLQLKLDRPGS